MNQYIYIRLLFPHMVVLNNCTPRIHPCHIFLGILKASIKKYSIRFDIVAVIRHHRAFVDTFFTEYRYTKP